MEFYNDIKIKRTRKTHKCFLCNLDIPKENECLYEVGKYEGDFFSRYSHNECSQIWLKLNNGLYSDDEWCELSEMGYPDYTNYIVFIKLKYLEVNHGN